MSFNKSISPGFESKNIISMSKLKANIQALEIQCMTDILMTNSHVIFFHYK